MMDWNAVYGTPDEKPLDRLVEGYSNTSIFRTIAVVGDSMSSGEMQVIKEDGTNGYHDLYEYSWGQYIARHNGCMVYNFSKGGMTARQYIASFAADRGFWDKEKACQAYIIAMGLNDLHGEKTPIGSVADIDPDDYRNNKPTYVGNYAHIVSRLKEISPDAKFFFVTFANAGAADTEDQVAAMYALAAYFDNAYVIDMYRYGPQFDKAYCERFYLNGHMSPSGYLFYGRLIDSYIDYIIRHNPADFREVALIGTDIKNHKGEEK